MGATIRQYLNAADRLMLVGHDGFHSIGHPGFTCQTHVRLRGSPDADRLQRAVQSLAERYPIMTARLRRNGRDPYWESTDEPPAFRHVPLAPGDGEAIWTETRRLFDAPLVLEREPPLAFHLLSESDGRATLVLRFSHVFIDGKAPELILRLVDEYFRGEAPQTPPTAKLPDDEMTAHLRRFSRRHRFRSTLRVIYNQLRWPPTRAIMSPPDQTDWRIAPVGLAVRTLDETATSKITDRVKRVCGFPNLLPAVLASTFRAISRCTPRPTSPQTWYQTDCPLNLRPPGIREPVFRNFMTFIQLHARHDELGDRDEITRRLSIRMRDQIRRGIDLGNLQIMALICRYASALQPHIIAQLKRRPFTLGFGYLGPVAPELARFCGQDVENVYTFNVALAPPGVTLQANQFAGRINLMLSYITSSVSEELAGRLLDEIASDLCQ